MAGEVAEQIEIQRSQCLRGVQAVFLPRGISQARFKLISGLIVKRGGKLTPTVSNGTTHVLASSWLAIEEEFKCHAELWSRVQADLKLLSFEWICASLCEASHALENEFRLREDDPRPVARPVTIYIDPNILVPKPGAVERCIRKLKEMDERARVKRAKQLQVVDDHHKEVLEMKQQYKLGNWGAAEQIRGRIRRFELANWGESSL